MYSPSKRKREGGDKEGKEAEFAHVEPKVMVPFLAAPGRLPRNIVVEKIQKLYQGIEIDALLDELGIEWRNPKLAPGSWLPLEAFDNNDFESRLAEEWVAMIKESGGKPLMGKVRNKLMCTRHFLRTQKMGYVQ